MTNNDEIKEIFDDLRSILDKDDDHREKILKISRQAVRKCAETIRAVHRREMDLAKETLSSVEQDLEQIVTMIGDNNQFVSISMTAFQEYIEALELYSFVVDSKLISFSSIPNNLPIPYIAYLHGICDLIGEFRRLSLDAMRKDELSFAEKTLNLMDDIFIQLTTLDYPNGLVPGVRRKTDISRSLIEKTRGDLTLAFNRNVLAKKLDEFSNKL